MKISTALLLLFKGEVLALMTDVVRSSGIKSSCSLIFLLISIYLTQVSALRIGIVDVLIKLDKRAPLQDLVAGPSIPFSSVENLVMIFPGDSHLFRLPSPGTFLDDFRKDGHGFQWSIILN